VLGGGSPRRPIDAPLVPGHHRTTGSGTFEWLPLLQVREYGWKLHFDPETGHQVGGSDARRSTFGIGEQPKK
jgi:hypothetical protein